MASFNESGSNDGCSSFIDSCLLCGGTHLWENCPTLPTLRDWLCEFSTTFDWNFCKLCGGRWNDCPKCHAPSPNNFCDDSNDVCEFDRSDKVQVVSETWLMEQAKLLEAYGDFRSELTNMTRQFMEERVELGQEIDQFGLTIHDLEANLSDMVEVSNAQLSVVVDSRFEIEELRSQFEEQKVEFLPFDPILVDDAKVEEITLESSEEIENIIFEDSSVCASEGVKSNATLELKRIGPHSNHFSTLCLDGDMKIEPPEPMKKQKEEEQGAYILEFVMPRRQNDIPHLKAKKCKMRQWLLGPFVFLPPPQYHSCKLEAKLGIQFISSRWRKK